MPDIKAQQNSIFKQLIDANKPINFVVHLSTCRLIIQIKYSLKLSLG